MKILHIISQRPEHTGSGIYLRALIREAAKKGHTSYMVAGVPRDAYPEMDTIPDENCRYVEFEGRDLPFPVVGMSDIMPYHSHRFSDLTPEQVTRYQSAFREKLSEAVELFAPDIIHSHHLWIMTALAQTLFPGHPLVASCHGTDLRQAVLCPDLAGPVITACSNLAGVTALSRIQAEQIAGDYGISSKKITIVGGGYNHKLFTAGNKSDSGLIDILYAGKLSRAKGVPWLLKSLEKIKTLPWHLHLAGSSSGPEYERCLFLAKRLSGKVTFHGLVDQSTLAGLMRKAHIFVLPSFFEGLPLVLLEALASGCRIISTDLPGVKEVFQTLTGDEVNLLRLPELESIDKPFVDDEAGLEDALAELLQHQIKAALDHPCINLTTHKDVLKRYTWKAVFDRIESVYKKCTNLTE